MGLSVDNSVMKLEMPSRLLIFMRADGKLAVRKGVDYGFNPLFEGKESLEISERGDGAQMTIDIEHNRNLGILFPKDSEEYRAFYIDIEAKYGRSN